LPYCKGILCEALQGKNAGSAERENKAMKNC